MTFTLLEVCMRKKMLSLLFSVSLFFVSVFVRVICFYKKIHWLKISLITSFTLLLISSTILDSIHDSVVNGRIFASSRELLWHYMKGLDKMKSTSMIPHNYKKSLQRKNLIRLDTLLIHRP